MSFKVKLAFGLAILLLLVVALGFLSKEEIQVEPVVVEDKAVEEVEVPFSERKTIGSSVEGRTIDVYTFGSGDRNVLFVGGIHGGYEWNSSLLAYELIDYIDLNNDFVPEDLKISIIPSLNPDGLFNATGLEGKFKFEDVPNPEDRIAEGRFNANGVDLNRNFDCKWQPESTWRGDVVSAGNFAFSEPEAVTLRDFVSETMPSAVVFWHSKAGNVYASECENGVLPETLDVMEKYAEAGDYGAVPSFDAYPITGDAEGYLASIGIPSVTVELETHDSIEWERNLAGVTAVLEKFSFSK